MDSAPFGLSEALLNANRRLLALRPAVEHEFVTGDLDKVVTPLSEHDVLARVREMPAHLGWHSQVATKCLRQTRAVESYDDVEGENSQQPIVNNQQSTMVVDAQSPISNLQSLIAIHPALAMALLKEGQVAAGRVWLLLRHLDVAGRGWVDLEMVRGEIAGKNSLFHLCGWRQLRKLLAAGEGVFWERDKTRVWLRSLPKVAYSLNVAHLDKPVSLPIAVLTGKIGDLRAQLYATFHTNDQPKTTNHTANPISRETLCKVTGVGRRTQRAYEKRAGISATPNYVLGEKISGQEDERTTRQEEIGQGTFKFVDHKGKHGEVGATYIAWQLPNSYRSGLEVAKEGRRKRLNQQLNDLYNLRDTGNGQEMIERKCRQKQTYYSSAKKASQSKNAGNHYWQTKMGWWYEWQA